MYTVPWTTLAVDGSTTDADDIDEKLTNIKTALEERFEEVLIEDAEDDPWVLKDTAGGPVIGKSLLIPHTMFHERTGGAGDPSINDISTGVLGTCFPMQAPVVVPPGCTITLIEFLVNNAGDGSISWEFYRYPHSLSPAKGLLDNGSSATSGIQIISKAVSILVSNAHYYYISLDTSISTTAAQLLIYGARITYNAPSSKETR